jgi:hypothetical protein
MIAWFSPDKIPMIIGIRVTARHRSKAEGKPRDGAPTCRPVRRRHFAGHVARSADREGGFVRRRFGLRHANGPDLKHNVAVLPGGTRTDRVRPRRDSRAINAPCAETLFAQKTCASAPTPAAGSSANGNVAPAARASATVMASATLLQCRGPHRISRRLDLTGMEN